MRIVMLVLAIGFGAAVADAQQPSIKIEINNQPIPLQMPAKPVVKVERGNSEEVVVTKTTTYSVRPAWYLGRRAAIVRQANAEQTAKVTMASSWTLK